MHHRRHPVRGPSLQPVLDSLTVIIRMHRFADERRAVPQAACIDHRPPPGRRVTDCPDINAAPAAQQVIRGTGAKAITLHQRPVSRPDIGLTRWIGHRPRPMRATERAGARPYRHVGGRLRQPHPNPDIPAVTAALMLHGPDRPTFGAPCPAIAIRSPGSGTRAPFVFYTIRRSIIYNVRNRHVCVRQSPDGIYKFGVWRGGSSKK